MKRTFSSLVISAIGVVSFLAFVLTTGAESVHGQNGFRVGEKLTYQMSLGRFSDIGFAELSVVSQGRMSGRNVVELRSRIKTRNIVSAVFFMTDETRTVYADPETGSPLYIVTRDESLPIAKESVRNFLTQPAVSLDLVTMIYKARESVGNGTLVFNEKERSFTANFVSGLAEKVRTITGEYDTVVSTVTSEWLSEIDVKNVRINFSQDEDRVPVQIRFTTSIGEGRLILSGHLKPQAAVQPSPTPTPQVVKPPTPVPTPTPVQYQPNRPLLPELGFELGERLQYRVNRGPQTVATVVVAARERKRFQNIDSLMLVAEVVTAVPNASELSQGDTFVTQADPDTLAPRWLESKFRSSPLLTRTVLFDPISGSISVAGAQPVDGPMGTHTLLSLFYAMRSFNLKRSNDPTNPVNDTRVAVFWDNRAQIFTLRPSDPEDIVIAGKKISAQLISISTGVPLLDALALKVWLSNEQGRVPLRITIGTLTAELITPAAEDTDKSR